MPSFTYDKVGQPHTPYFKSKEIFVMMRYFAVETEIGIHIVLFTYWTNELSSHICQNEDAEQMRIDSMFQPLRTSLSLSGRSFCSLLQYVAPAHIVQWLGKKAL